jgi:hypothetical protein
VISVACPGCGVVVDCDPEAYGFTDGVADALGVEPCVEFEQTADGWVGYFIALPTDNSPYPYEPIARLHECSHGRGGDGSGDRAPLVPNTPRREAAAARDLPAE